MGELILTEKRDEWNAMPSPDCTDLLLPTQQAISSLELAALSIRNTIRGNQVSLLNNLDVKMCCAYAVKHFVAMIESIKSTS